ncbi:MAG TPA: hypothetical protein VK179_19490 [Bacteroidales bacterium]|nr:hypothetical protein [Bacteroidales bacterium]
MEYIMNDVKTLGWSATGRKYGVSDNAVRKWVRQYEKEQNNMNYNGERARHGRDVTVIVRDVETGDISYYDSVKDCTAKTGFSITTIRHHMKHRTVYMQKYIILPGEEHDKYVNVELQLSKELDGAITRLTDTIPSLSFDKFCNALIRDWLSDQEKSKNITGSIYGKMK